MPGAVGVRAMPVLGLQAVAAWLMALLLSASLHHAQGTPRIRDYLQYDIILIEYWR